jgi:hypothetical protein
MTAAAAAPVTPEGPGDAACLPAIPGNGRFGRNEIDRRATGVAVAARDDLVSEVHARRVIAALLYGSTIPESVAAQWNADRQDRADIADRLRMLVYMKVMQETPGGFHPDRVADGASACGWATQLARAALPGAARDALLPRRERAVPAVLDPSRDGDSPGSHSIAETADLVAVLPDIADRAVAAADRATGRDISGDCAADAGLQVVRGMRPGSRRHRGAVYLSRSFGVPALDRPQDYELTARIATALDANPLAARRSARAELARRSGSLHVEGDPDDPVAMLWSGYPGDALGRLAELDHRVAHAVAVGSVAPRPAIRGDVVAALAAQVARLEPGDPDWAQLARDLVAAFAAHECDLPSEFSPGFRTATPKPAAQKAFEARAFADVSRRVADHPSAPLGAVPAMVESELQDRLLVIETVIADLHGSLKAG